MKKIIILLFLIPLYMQIISFAEVTDLQSLKYKYPGLGKYDERGINSLGYRLLNQGKIDEAIELFELNTKLYPKSWNAYDSLGEGYMNAGKTEMAIQSYKKSLKLNPRNINGKRMLGRLVHPEMVKFTGRYEFYENQLYQWMTVFIEDGKLVLHDGRKNILEMTPVNLDNMDFIAVDKYGSYPLTFLEKKRGEVSEIRWIEKGEIINGKKRTGSILKDFYSVEELREDFIQFRNLVEKNHVSPYEFIEKDIFDQLFDTQLSKIDKPMTLNNFYNLLVPLKAKIGCGHGHLDYPGEYRRNVQVFKFPLLLKVLNDRLFVKKNLNGKTTIPLYSEILSINGVETKEIVRILKNIISADGYNESYLLHAIESNFQYYYANYYGIYKVFQFKVGLESSEEIKKITVPAIPVASINYSNKGEKELNLEIMLDKNTALMTINSFMYYRDQNRKFFSFIDESFQKIKKQNIENLIIDLRENGGGDPFCANYLLSYIMKKPYVYFAKPYGRYKPLAEKSSLAENRFSGNLYIITNGSNFSTTGHLCSILKYHNRGVFVGSETGSTYTCNAAVKQYHLKNSRLLVKLASGSFATAVEGFSKRSGIIPDFKVSPDVISLKENRDKIIEYILELIKSKHLKPAA